MVAVVYTINAKGKHYGEIIGFFGNLCAWCNENCSGVVKNGNMEYLAKPQSSYMVIFSFENEADAVAFKLRWV